MRKARDRRVAPKLLAALGGLAMLIGISEAWATSARESMGADAAVYPQVRLRYVTNLITPDALEARDKRRVRSPACHLPLPMHGHYHGCGTRRGRGPDGSQFQLRCNARIFVARSGGPDGFRDLH